MLLETRKDGTKFTNRALKEAAQKLSSFSTSYDKLQQELVDQVIHYFNAFVSDVYTWALRKHTKSSNVPHAIL